MIGAVLDGMAPGIAVDESFIAHRMDLRRAVGTLSTARRESDRVDIVSGVVNGRTTGTPITFIIGNSDTKSGDYSMMSHIARPGHADLTAYEKYHGFADFRGGGHFSGRITAGLVAAGAVAASALSGKGIHIGTHIKSCAGIADRDFEDTEKDIVFLENKDFAVLDPEAEKLMKNAIEEARNDGDSVGGILETVITGVPAGVGEPWFDTVEGVLSHIIFGIPAVKGVEFGDGFALAGKRGSTANDAFFSENGKIYTKTNSCGGILGGITNGMPILMRCVVKPTPSIYKEQQTVDFINGQDTALSIKGRHDPAIIHRARIVVDSAAALVMCDLLAQRFGTDYLYSPEK